MPPRTKAARYATQTYGRLRNYHPDAECELKPREPFRLLVAIVLSAQTTDIAVNKVLPRLFADFPDVRALACAEPSDVAERLKTIGMFRQKAKHVVGLSSRLINEHGGKVPQDHAALMKLPGVGRKTANVLMGVAFNQATGIVVDTHVQRLSQRLGWTRESKPEGIEKDLMKLFPKGDWIMLSHVLIFHGRRVCRARAPGCEACPVMDICPSAGSAEKVGRKPVRHRK
ncbi:MAG: endonuclease III [Sorangium cellulosum]|nr:MAG: endonuclease III [Sorangium cellulosum]